MKKIVSFLLCLAMLMAVSIPALAAEYADFGFIKKIPMKPKYTQGVENQGTVEKITYTCHSYAEEEKDGGEKMVDKDMYVYLPFGYDASKEYNVLYLMHGAGEDERYWLSDERMGKPTCAVLDYLHDKGECESTIVVATSVYLGREVGTEPVYDSEIISAKNEGYSITSIYYQELVNDIIPLVETRFSTYANGDVTTESLKASREHRAFAGFSMGSITTESVMQHCLDLFAYIGNYSAGNDNEVFFEAMDSEEFKDLPIKFWYHGEGSEDFAKDGHVAFCNSIMNKMADRVVDGENYAYVEFKGGTHAYNCWLPHLYNCMRVFFK